MIGIVILIVTLLVFGSMAAYYIWAFHRLVIPPGLKITYTYRGYKVHTVLDPNASTDKTVLAMAAKMSEKAVAAANAAWIQCGNDSKYQITPDSKKEVLVYWTTEQAVEAVVPHSASFEMMTPVYAGHSYVPKIAIKIKYLEEVKNTGEPVIHEMMHALQPIADDSHSSPFVWTAAQKLDLPAVQTVAREIYKKYVEEG